VIIQVVGLLQFSIMKVLYTPLHQVSSSSIGSGSGSGSGNSSSSSSSSSCSAFITTITTITRRH
jgi:hypothetical protein